MDITADFKSFQERLTSSLVNVTRTVGQISAEDLSFHRSSNVKLSRGLDAQNAYLLQLTNRLLKAATKDTQIRQTRVHNQEDLEDKWRNIVDVIDDLLEKSDACLDEYTGVIKRLSPSLQDGTSTPPDMKDRLRKAPSLFSSYIMPKPQLHFSRAIANHETAPFKPLLRTKPHALVPLEENISSGQENFNHPYALEIKQSRFPPPTYALTEPIPWVPLAEQPVTFVDTEDGLAEMLADLKNAKELAVDLEHHDLHSYIGIVCLMQISTREKDWIVDTLKTWRENLQCLNEVFADPNILKVFHGSHEDMIWLQRDLGLYIVGLFDTYHACVALNFEGRGLKYLLKRFANFDAQKKYQTADWRARPLPDEMMHYARSDTHYLLNIYDNLRNMLIESSTPEQDHLEYVLNESKKEALQRYERPLYDSETGLGPTGWYNAFMRRSLKFDKEQLAVYRALHEWRDTKARDKDEGVSSIMTAAQLWNISEAMPMSVTGLMGSIRPISKSISDNSKELVELIRTAKDSGRQGPPVVEILMECEAKLEASGRSRPQPWRWLKEHRQPKPDIGLGATVQMLLDEKNSKSEPIVTRALTSTFWGKVLAVTATAEPPLPEIATEALRMILPLPPKQEMTFTDTADEPALVEPSSSPTIPTLPGPHTNTTNLDSSAPNSPTDEPFVIRELARASKKRKANASRSTANGSPSHPAATSSAAAVEAAIDLELRTQRQLERKARKEAKTAEAATAPPMVPFDYASAESVLHAGSPGKGQQHQREKGGEGSAKKRSFDPYQKALDTGTGLKKMRKEGAGKSMTFH